MTDFVWQGRYDGDDTNDARLWQIIKKGMCPKTAPHPAYALVGFQSDEGVRRNHGRTGAYDAPDTLRNALANLPYNGAYDIYDTGNISCMDKDLQQAQTALAKHVHTLIHNTHTPIILGGGHETSFGGLMGVHQAYPNDIKIGIVNFDAHFDLRTTADNIPTSGTPFSDTHRVFTEDNRDFTYFCMGIAKSSNTNTLFKRADALGVQYCYDTECHMHPNKCVQKLTDFIKSVDNVYITIDMDTFHGGIAPGVSAVNPMGIPPVFVETCLYHITQTNRIIALDVVEINPKYDKNTLTARLGARLIHSILPYTEMVPKN